MGLFAYPFWNNKTYQRKAQELSNTTLKSCKEKKTKNTLNHKKKNIKKRPRKKKKKKKKSHRPPPLLPSCSKAIQVLTEHHLLSAPVVDDEGRAGWWTGSARMGTDGVSLKRDKKGWCLLKKGFYMFLFRRAFLRCMFFWL